MNSVAAALLVWTLTSPSSGGHGRGDAWPTHRACSSGGLEVFYQSCDPLQDFGLSIDQCARHIQPSLNIRFGIILREDISKLFLDIALVSGGSSFLNFSYPICEEDLPKFSFCGRRKGAWENQLPLLAQQDGNCFKIPAAEGQQTSSDIRSLTHITPTCKPASLRTSTQGKLGP
ncbi:lymphocyte antigen 86 isoform X1 [Microtus oregoni]|uniref:lymphocyte antigen 86 isoform X1 n=1 Tax=Microtus oregoni TaxID=111838 RepID=UPI001BB1432B|nr:lymphocyte antigen 86 isoform X1 [Microtus oregoni]